MESARSAFHAQLASVMDSLLAAAVCEIAKIFESSLCEQQAELAQKTEEISVLRCKLDKVEKRQKVKGAGSEDGELSSGDREGSARQQTLTGAGPSVEKDLSSPSDPLDGLCRLKEEVPGQDGVLIKHERAASRLNQASAAAQTSEESLSAAEQKQIDALSTIQVKTKLTHWDQSARGADRRLLRDQGSTPFLAISQSGRCSPRTDPSLAQPGEWLAGLEPTRGGVTSLENLQADGSSTGGDASCFRPGFGSDETSNEGEESFPFLDQEPENQNSDQNSVQGQGVGQRGTQQDQSQLTSSDSPWRSRDDRSGRGPVNNTRRITNFGNRDPLRLQLNSQSLTLRHSITLNHPPASGGGTGRPYTCPYCTKCFTYPSHQRRHLLRHTGVRLHPCQFCEKSFLTPSELTVHTRTHTGERPFGCTQCGKRFARSGNLRAHQRDVHMGKRPFACTECGKRFAHRGNLRVHNHRVHQGDPYYLDDQPEPDIGPNPI
ncbi:zinc finger protein with KRAB and SCAN domains 1-like [Salarias fasciatus]|uniref:Zinc finger protein with KRAB and SCAN domains 1-like n=1 Tax=Salarias fasciatus TaxID=181472 RepID=A0A672IDQ7_SALFA|nr:zinc finger protein with KRAB and SCAN domains 1-like [Salarias fasciatus]